jgi:hypothetical protein
MLIVGRGVTGQVSSQSERGRWPAEARCARASESMNVWQRGSRQPGSPQFRSRVTRARSTSSTKSHSERYADAAARRPVAVLSATGLAATAAMSVPCLNDTMRVLCPDGNLASAGLARPLCCLLCDRAHLLGTSCPKRNNRGRGCRVCSVFPRRAVCYSEVACTGTGLGHHDSITCLRD